MHILIKFPSRSRPDKLRSAFVKYVQMAENTSHISFLVNLDEDDPTITRSQQTVLKRVHPDTQIIVGPPLGKVGAVNRDMEHAPPFDILLLASDDMIPQVRGYDQIIRNNMQTYYPDTDGVLHFNDGVRGEGLNTLCILGKKYYDRFGYIYHPSYKSLWCDNEFTDISNSLHKSTYIDAVIIRHEHPLWTNTGYDELYKQNDAYDTEDKTNYTLRKSLTQSIT